MGTAAAESEGRRPSAAAWVAFEEEVLGSPWGTIAKSELELKVFRLLTATGSIDPDAGDGEIATRLKVPVARVRAMRYRLDQEAIGDDYLEAVVERFEVHRTDVPGDVHLVIDSRYLRERVVERLRSERIAVRRELAGELLRLHVRDLVAFVVTADDLPETSRETLIASLVPAWRDQERAGWKRALSSAQGLLSTTSDAQSLTSGLLRVLDQGF